VAFSGDSQKIISGGWDGKVKIWKASSGEEIGVFELDEEESREEVTSVDYSENSKFVAAASGTTLKIWSAKNMEEIYATK
jgi:WD40 repeat protein